MQLSFAHTHQIKLRTASHFAVVLSAISVFLPTMRRKRSASRTFVGWVIAVLGMALLVSGQNPVIKIGRTESRVGPIATFAIEAEKGYSVFQAAIGSTIDLGGKIYNISHVVYNDGSDVELMTILYQRLVEVDNVDFLFSPFGFGTSVLDYAEQKQIPMMNCALFDYVNSPRPLNWVVSLPTTFQSLADVCMPALKNTTAKTFALIYEQVVATYVPTFESTLKTSFQLVTPDAVDSLSTEQFSDEVRLDALVKKWHRSRPDILLGALSAKTAPLLLNRILKLKYQPPLFWAAAGASDPTFRANSLWKAGGMLITADFELSLNFTDDLFGSSAGYNNLRIQLFNQSTAGSDVWYALGGSILYTALKAAGTKDKTAVMAQIRSFQKETLAGVVTFDQVTGVTRRPTFCLQFSPDGLSLLPVKPSPISTAVELQYPALPIQYAKGFLPKSKKLLVKILVPILGSLFLVVLIGGITFLFFRSKYHMVFVPKSARQEEWT